MASSGTGSSSKESRPDSSSALAHKSSTSSKSLPGLSDPSPKERSGSSKTAKPAVQHALEPLRKDHPKPWMRKRSKGSTRCKYEGICPCCGGPSESTMGSLPERWRANVVAASKQMHLAGSSGGSKGDVSAASSRAVPAPKSSEPGPSKLPHKGLILVPPRLPEALPSVITGGQQRSLNPGPDSKCWCNKKGPPGHESARSVYLRTVGCDAAMIRNTFVNIQPGGIRRWTEYNLDVLSTVFRDILTNSTPAKRPEEVASLTLPGCPRIRQERDFHRLLIRRTLPLLRLIIEPTKKFVRDDFDMVTVDHSPRLQTEGPLLQPRDPEPDIVIAGCRFGANTKTVVLAVGIVTMPDAFSSSMLENPKDDMTLDAVRHTACVAKAAGTRHGFILTPRETTVFRFALDDVAEKGMHVEWTATPLFYRRGVGMPSNLVLCCLAYMGFMEETRRVEKVSQRRPINEWRKVEGGYASVVNPRQVLRGLPRSALLTK